MRERRMTQGERKAVYRSDPQVDQTFEDRQQVGLQLGTFLLLLRPHLVFFVFVCYPFPALNMRKRGGK